MRALRESGCALFVCLASCGTGDPPRVGPTQQPARLAQSGTESPSAPQRIETTTAPPPDASARASGEPQGSSRQVLSDPGAQLSSCQEELEELRAEIRRLRAEFSEVSRPVVVSQGSAFAEYLAFKTSLPTTADTWALRSLAALLEEYPVRLTPEEGDWLLSRFQASDWMQFPGGNDPVMGDILGVFLHFLGPGRVLAETGPQPWLVHMLDEQEWKHVFGTAMPRELVDR